MVAELCEYANNHELYILIGCILGHVNYGSLKLLFISF